MNNEQFFILIIGAIVQLIAMLRKPPPTVLYVYVSDKQSIPQGTSHNTTQDTSHDTTQGTSQDTSQDTTQGTSQDTSQDTSHNTTQGTSYDTPRAIS